MLLRIVFPLGTDSYLITEGLTDSVLMVEGLTDSSVIIEVLATLVFRFLVNFFRDTHVAYNERNNTNDNNNLK